MPASRSVQQGNLRVGEKFLYDFKAGPAGGRLRRPPSAGSPRQPPDRPLPNLLAKEDPVGSYILR
jgi:hypothetical protein